MNKKNLYDNVLEIVGNTPALRLKKVESYFNLDNEVYAKIEYMNPGGSIKDRMGIYLLKMAEKNQLINKDTIIVEPTSGNTGVGLALYSTINGNKLIFTMPSKISKEKELLLKAYGAFVVRTPTNVKPDAPNSYYSVSKIIAKLIWKKNKKLTITEIEEIVIYVQNLVDTNNLEKLNNILKEDIKENLLAYIPNQYFNKYNPESHYRLTAQEIWSQFDGNLDYIFAGIGTGGTITGISKFFKERKEIKVIGVDPIGSIYYLIKNGMKLEKAIEKAHTYKVEGIGEDILPETINLNLIDDISVVNDQESFSMTRFLAKKEGILVGGSSGAALIGAIKYIKKNNIKRKKILVIFPDSGRGYLNKIFNNQWLIENNFEVDDEKILEVLK
ncbi:cystathionine beta-synthase [Marinitoga hydrogenitolerans DSM 16785]|uniref:cysteine synthase n=1 Tax=Marinitoga hydrogenitolerans (strain DSM 16785 / JCM 12826 / AT1271) TaxID=1122195 RepID=A0A1M4WWS4_MARH1|nr:pyridoxal-phosphate dependent enzyme [Marinitoga hydrogenitolerans]SHE85432.1 cystathionine beta-synthase [Marinitoga hydrogenitolerans DSM 16785]